MTKQTVIHVDEGKYMINVQALHGEVNEPSAMASYLSQAAIVTNQDSSLHMTIMFMDHQTVTGFQIENEVGEWSEAIDRKVNEETNSRFEIFELERLMSPLHVRVQYEVEHEGQQIKGDETLRLVFDEESLANVE